MLLALTSDKNVQGDDWYAIDRRLRSIARQRAALDAEEAQLLRAANRMQIWRTIGCVSMLDYMERYLGYGIRSAQERLQLALALESLPGIEAALASGALAFSKARTLLRVATPENEEQWLAHCKDMSVHEIEEAVSGHEVGDEPTEPKKPDLRLRDVLYRAIRPSTAALEREALAKARELAGGRLEDDRFLAMLYGSFIDGSTPANDESAGRAKHQVAIVVCQVCDQAWRESVGKKFALDASELARVRCDAQHIGSLDTDDPARATQDIPPRIRRFVWRRDGGHCAVPGCRSCVNLEIHHIIAREDGGSHDPSNLMLICDSCHTARHRGLIMISGKAPEELVITRKHAATVGAVKTSTFDRVAIDVDAKSALVNTGYSRAEAAAAVAAARAEVPGDLALDALLREALRRCRKPK